MLAHLGDADGLREGGDGQQRHPRRRHGTSTDVSFMVGGKYKMEGTINAEGQVEKVRTWIDQPIVGDMLVETTYSDYKDFGGGVVRPSHLVQTQDGYPSLDLTISRGDAQPGR